LKIILFGLLTSLLFFTSCASEKKTKLVVVLVADQMRPDHFSRFSKLYSGGLKWLMDNSLSFQNAFHQHGYTAAGPGYIPLPIAKCPGPVAV
jgi:hypothetical protein